MSNVRVEFTEIETTRRCGECTLCCKLLPVRELGKGAGERCKHQRHTGCRVYHRPSKGFPMSCAAWSCLWLARDGTEDFKRPDRSHYVLDMMPDFVTIEDPDHGRVEVECAQIWIDPNYPDAHRDPALRAWLEKRNVLGLVRFPDHKDIVLIPPGRMKDRTWLERTTNLESVGPHSIEQVIRAIGAGH